MKGFQSRAANTGCFGCIVSLFCKNINVSKTVRTDLSPVRSLLMSSLD